MPQEIRASRPRAFACRRLFFALVASGLIGCLPAAILHAQSSTVHGYITAVHPPNGFDVNGEQVTTTAETQFGLMGTKNQVNYGPMRDAIEIGAWVEVFGAHDPTTKTVAAQTVLFRDRGDRKLTALAVIERVFSTTPELVFAADGYHIRVTPATEVKFPHDVKSAVDVHAGMWALYEGKLGQDGLLVASKVRFVSTDHAKAKSDKAPGDSSVLAAAPQAPANGDQAAKANAQPPNNAPGQPENQIIDLRTEVDLDGVSYGISKDEALKSRVRRIGMSLVPAYQKQLPEGASSKIQFEFITVKNQMRDEQTSSEGLILVPAKLAERFKNDDQLAAVLADGIAYSLQQQAPIVFQMNRAELAEAAGLVAVSFVPYAGPLAESVGGQVMLGKYDRALKEQRWRVALELMADADYDPWQAPEAWRLAGPGKLPADTSTLKFPDRSGYQFAILNLMYKKPATTHAAVSGSPANTSASGKP